MSLVHASAVAGERRYNVFKVRDTTALPDADMPGPRYHTFIFVETETDGSGYIHQVTGDLVTGMKYESKPAGRPESSEAFHSKDLIGTVLASSYPSNVDEVCRAQQPPGRQKAFNIRTVKTEPVKADGTFYQPGEHRSPLFKCTEWTEQLAIPALRDAGMLETTSIGLKADGQSEEGAAPNPSEG